MRSKKSPLTRRMVRLVAIAADVVARAERAIRAGQTMSARSGDHGLVQVNAMVVPQASFAGARM